MAKKSQSATAAKVETLKHEKEKLKAENERLKARVSRSRGISRRPANSFWGNLTIILCVALATATLVAGNILFWAGSTIVDTDKYVQTTQPLLEDKAVQAAIAGYTTNQLFNQVNVEQTVQGALPPRAEFLAPQLTSQLHGATDKTLQKVLASDKFQSIWADTNRAAHDKLISAVKNSKGDGVVNIQEVYDNLSQNLKDTKLSFLADKSLPQNIGSITLIHAEWVPKARAFINAVSWMKPVSLLLLAILSSAAIWLARSRRRLVITLGSFFSASMAALLVAICITRHQIATQVAPAYQTAADHAAGIILHPLAVKSLAILLFSLVVIGITWLSAPYQPASWLRSRTRQWLTTPIHRFIFRNKENQTTKWLAQYKPGIEWAIVAIVGLACLLREISPKMVIASTLLVLALVLITETLAAPHSKR